MFATRDGFADHRHLLQYCSRFANVCHVPKMLYHSKGFFAEYIHTLQYNKLVVCYVG